MARIYGTAGNDIRNFSSETAGIEYFTRGGNDIVIGTSEGDIFHAEGGYRDNFRNIFFGGAGNDVFHGGEGRSTFVGGVGADTFYGGYGVDTLSYEHSSAAARVDLKNNPFSGGEAAVLSGVVPLTSADFIL